jgi:superfamily I DNA/RNA helicase
MKERIIKEIEKNAKGQDGIPFVATFHSLGVYIIKENASLLGLTRHFSILDESDAISIIKESLKELNLDPKEYEPKKIKGIISREKGKFTKEVTDFAGRFIHDTNTDIIIFLKTSLDNHWVQVLILILFNFIKI